MHHFSHGSSMSCKIFMLRPGGRKEAQKATRSPQKRPWFCEVCENPLPQHRLLGDGPKVPNHTFTGAGRYHFFAIFHICYSLVGSFGSLPVVGFPSGSERLQALSGSGRVPEEFQQSCCWVPTLFNLIVQRPTSSLYIESRQALRCKHMRLPLQQKLIWVGKQGPQDFLFSLSNSNCTTGTRNIPTSKGAISVS